MKYIRTKDGILDLDKIFPPGYATIDGEVIKVSKEGQLLINYDKIFDCKTKLADTIEELCDEAVFFDKDNKPHYKSQEGNIWYLGAGLFTETLRFGIFTNKGLIYVAKMNDKGELELL